MASIPTYSQFVDKAETPVSGRVFCHISVELLMVCLPHIIWHCNRLVNGVCKLLCIPRVYNDRAVQRLGSTGEFRQDQDAMRILLRGNVLIRDEVHTITSWRDEAHVRSSIESSQFVKRNGPMHEMDRHKLDGSCKANASVPCIKLEMHIINLPYCPLIRPTSSLIVLLRCWYSSTSSRDGMASCTSTTLPTHSGCWLRNTSIACIFCGTPLM